MSKDYYALLEIDKNAEQQQIKKAYRQKARRLHPDLNPSERAKDEFQELQEAYSVLSDENLKQQYDAGTLFDREIVPPPPPPDGGFQPGQDWNKHYQYGSDNTYSTDFEANRTTSFWVCLCVLVFSLTFFTDLIFSKTLGTSTVLSVQNKALMTQNLNDVNELIIQTGRLTFEKQVNSETLSPGDIIEIKQSLIYKFLSFKKIESSSFAYVNAVPILVYLTALIVLICGLFGVTPFTKAERKFNAAIVGSFFSFALIIFLTFG